MKLKLNVGLYSKNKNYNDINYDFFKNVVLFVILPTCNICKS